MKDLSEVYKVVYQYFRPFGPIPGDLWEVFCAKLSYLSFDTGDFFQKAETSAKYLGLVISGLFRIYYANSDGKEFTRSFSDEFKPIGDYACALVRTEATVNIVAIEPSKVAAIKFEDYFDLLEHHPCWDRIGRKVVELYYVQREKREAQLVMLSARERYDHFLRDNQNIAARASNGHIASYLAVTPETLSRLKRTKKKSL
jgi:CRP-like cAMP-binding protein